MSSCDHHDPAQSRRSQGRAAAAQALAHARHAARAAHPRAPAEDAAPGLPAAGAQPTRSRGATARPPRCARRRAQLDPADAAGALGRDRQGHLRSRAAQRARLAALPRGPRTTSPSSARSASARPSSPTRSATSPAAAATRCSPLRADQMLKTLKHARLDNTYEAELRKLARRRSAHHRRLRPRRHGRRSRAATPTRSSPSATAPAR